MAATGRPRARPLEERPGRQLADDAAVGAGDDASKQRGSYADGFASYAKTHAMARQRRLMLRALARSFVASPPHAVKAIATDAVLRRQAFAALTGRHAPLPDPEHSAAAG